jgi:hypothetical protein
MPDFWDNVFRFPRFFVSSVIGLILTILGPFLNLLNRPKTTVVFVIVSIIGIGFLTITLKLMLGITT